MAGVLRRLRDSRRVAERVTGHLVVRVVCSGICIGVTACAANRSGTTVFVSLALDSTVRPTDTYSAFGSEDAPLDFSRTQVPLRLLTDNGLTLDSRAQARWVVSRLELFATAELDFEGVDDVGPSFIDEVFRVYAKAHPGVALQPTKASGRIEKLLKGAMH